MKGDAQFSKDQYVLAMYLVEQVRSGRPLPARLPDELVPPSLRAKFPAAAAATWAPGSQGPPSVATPAAPQATSPSAPAVGGAAALSAAAPDSTLLVPTPAAAPLQSSKSQAEMTSMAALLGLQMPAPKPQPQPAAQLPAALPATAMLTPAEGTGPGVTVAATAATTIGTGVASVGAGVAQAAAAPAIAVPNYEAFSTVSGESAFASEVSRADAAQRFIEERRRGLDDFYEEERRARQKHNEEETERQRKRLEAIRLREYVLRNRLVYIYEFVCLQCSFLVRILQGE